MLPHAVYGDTLNIPYIDDAKMSNTSNMYICIYIYIFVIATRPVVDTGGLGMSKRNAKTRQPYSPGQAAKPAVLLGGKMAARRPVNRVPIVQKEVTPAKPVIPADTVVVDNTRSGSAGAGNEDLTLSSALRAELLELLRSTQNQVAARSSTATSSYEGFSTFELPKNPTVEDFEGNLKQVMANLPLEAGLNSKSPFVQHTLRFVNSTATATQELAEHTCGGISESLTKLRVIHEALSASWSAATDGAYRDQVQDLVLSTEEVMQHLAE